jgi:phosphatidyl-myo-inositol dimannoside synthase
MENTNNTAKNTGQASKNILLVSPTFFPVRGGTEQVVYEIARRLAKKHDVTLVTPKIKGAAWTEHLDGFTVQRIPNINKTGLNALIPQTFLSLYLPYLFAKKRLTKKKIDLVHLFHPYQVGGVIALLKKIMHYPLLLSLTGWDTYDPVKPLPKKVWPYLAFVMNSADEVTTMCTHMKKSAEKQGCKKDIKIVPHGTNMMKTTEKPGVDIREKHNIPKEHKIVFSLQRLFPRKGMHYLIKAIPAVLRQQPKTYFIIGGKGPEKEKLVTLANEIGVSKNVVFAGFVPDDELKNYYSTADVFAMPSLYEGFGLVYTDALSCGTPIVTTYCGGPEDIVDKDNGLLVPTHDEKAFAEALNNALNKKWDAALIIKDAEQYDWDTIIQTYEQLYNQIRK